ncbi:MAG: C40 family peptidase [Candidatus Niyogibacteria bacterium]|nr:C40 family peptidase [Candidatus Niyogibacteria bacterium]
MPNRKEKIEKIMNTAIGLLGTPYQYGAYATADKQNSKPESVDCSSFIQYVCKQAGVNLPRSSVLQAARGRAITRAKDLQAGDLIFFEGIQGHYAHKLFHGKKVYIGHVAIYIGNNEIIHARASLKRVAKQKLASLTKNPYFKIKLIKRIV